MPAGPRFHQIVNDAKAHIREITAQEASQEQRAGSLLIDVREAEEFAKEHSAGAIPMSRGTIELKIEAQAPDAATPIICYCGGGSRSALAAESLKRMGYTNVSSLIGGFKAWKDANLPTAT
jgi:rhodanese-related sulfurtransferase